MTVDGVNGGDRNGGVVKLLEEANGDQKGIFGGAREKKRGRVVVGTVGEC